MVIEKLQITRDVQQNSVTICYNFDKLKKQSEINNVHQDKYKFINVGNFFPDAERLILLRELQKFTAKLYW